MGTAFLGGWFKKEDITSSWKVGVQPVMESPSSCVFLEETRYQSQWKTIIIFAATAGPEAVRDVIISVLHHYRFPSPTASTSWSPCLGEVTQIFILRILCPSLPRYYWIVVLTIGQWELLLGMEILRHALVNILYSYMFLPDHEKLGLLLHNPDFSW